MKNVIIKYHDTFLIRKDKFKVQCYNHLGWVFFSQTPDKIQSETELSYWTMQSDWIKKTWIEKDSTD